jgi:S-adenosylmethionine hydrolase
MELCGAPEGAPLQSGSICGVGRVMGGVLANMRSILERNDLMSMTPVRRTSISLILVIAILFTVSVAHAADTDNRYPPTVVFMTDFGTLDDAVPICKGVMYSIFPQLRIVDITHQVTPYSILDGARYLFGTTPYFPKGTVFVVVVDPGVGSSRKAIVVKSKTGQFFVLPDNGLLTLVEKRDGIEEVHEITNPGWMIGSKLSSTFHGRDIFSPVGAHVARGEDWTQVGPAMPVKDLVRLDHRPATLNDRGLTGRIIATDGPFGNLVTNVEAEEFLKMGYERGQEVPVEIAGQKLNVPFVKTFSDVPLGKPLLYIDSRGRFGFAINQGNFSQKYGIGPGADFFIPRKTN